MLRKTGVAVAAGLCFGAIGGVAHGGQWPELTFNGYGTLGLVHSDEDRADFTADLFAPEGAGHTAEISPEVDSRLGLQASADFTPKLSGIVQVIVKQRYDDTYKPDLEWANLNYEITPDLNVRAGRMVLPLLLTGEYRNVGYALPWVRPPPEVYRIIPVTNFDGVALSYRSRFGGFTNTLRGTYGSKDAKLPEGGEVESEDGFSLIDTLEWGPATLYAGYSTLKLTIEQVNPFFDQFREFGPRGEAIADRFDVDDKRIELITLGARYEPGDWFVMGEWVRSESRTFFGESDSWYVSGGYRFGSLTPYVTVADTDVTSETSDPGLPLAGLPPSAVEPAASLNAALNGLLGSAVEQTSLSLGVRWDFARNAALKLQYDHIDLDDGSPGVLTNRQPGFQPGGTVNLISVTLDFVF